ncbi:MAG: glycogen debranching protein [Armatimonadetes bacterium]|nr:glycogen debranching protein [Armatimonadota bacterium]
MELVDKAFEHAKQALLSCTDKRGIKAAAEYYPHIWARDGIVSLYGALQLDDERTAAAARNTLDTLGDFMNDAGHVPNFLPVDATEPPKINNCIDSNEWYIIGHELYYRTFKDKGFLEENWERLNKAAYWLRCQDFNDCGLLEAHEGADWADLLANRFNVLFTNVLWWHSLRCMASLAYALGQDGSEFEQKAKRVGDIINMLFYLPESGGTENREKLAEVNGEWFNLYAQMQAKWWFRPYYLPYVEWRIPGAERFDTLGNMLAIVYGLADKKRAEGILQYVHEYGVNVPYPAKACYPVIYPGDPDWRDYYLNREYCKPHSAHNGGIWPFIGGFYVTALALVDMKDEAERELENLARANRLSRSKREWGFNELIHGESGQPIGAEYQAWSAAMYIVAYNAVTKGKCNLTGDRAG